MSRHPSPGKFSGNIAVLVMLALCSQSHAQPASIQFTAEQVARGETTYKETCQICHGNRLSNGQFGTPLKGSFFHNNWKGKTLGELVQQAYENMPPDNKMSMPVQQYAEVIAFILSRNDIAPGETPITDDLEALKQVSLPW